MNDIPKTQKKVQRIEIRIIPLFALTLLSGCATLTHQVTSQYNSVTLALAHERATRSQQINAVCVLAQHAQFALHQSAGIPIADQDLTKIQNVLTGRSQPITSAQKQTDSALAKLDHATVKAAKLAEQEQKDSSFFGIPGLLHHGLQLLSSTFYFAIAVGLLIGALYVGSFFFPPLGPIFAIVESLAIKGISSLSSLRK